MKIYRIKVSQSGYHDVHSLIREQFNSPVNICPSLLLGDDLYILSEAAPKSIKPEILDLPKIDSDTVTLDIRICLDTRHAGKKSREQGRSQAQKLYSQGQALREFCKRVGLSPISAICAFDGIQETKKFRIQNTFRIEGKFHIKQKDLFQKALTEGVGTRKSYGNGLILTRETKENL